MTRLDPLTRARAVLDEFEAAGLGLDALPGNSAKLRLLLDLARTLRAGTRLRVLDVGCGGRSHPFNLWQPLLPLASRLELSGVDVANLEPTRLRAAELGFPVDLREGGIHSLSRLFPEGSFDAVVSTQVLEHVRDWRAGLRELRHVVRPGGRVYLTLDSGTLRRRRAERARLQAKRLLSRPLAAAPALRRLPRLSGEWERGLRPGEIAAAAEDAGLRVEARRCYGVRELKVFQQPAGSATRILWLALEEAAAEEAADALDAGLLALLYVRATRV